MLKQKKRGSEFDVQCTPVTHVTSASRLLLCVNAIRVIASSPQKEPRSEFHFADLHGYIARMGPRLGAQEFLAFNYDGLKRALRVEQ